MGYEIHIVRRTQASEELEGGISCEEWTRVADADPSLRATTDASGAFYEFPEADGWFSWSLGSISTKHPNEATLAKAHEIALALRAKVQGDDGEIYLPNGEIIRNDVCEVVVYPWWIIGLCAFSIGCFIVATWHMVTH